jgi:hypothetical protein
VSYRITGDGPDKMRELTAKLKTADPILKRELRRALKDAATPAADAARASILAMPGTKVGTPPLRAAVAGSVVIRTSMTGLIQVSIVAEPNRMPPGMGNMPKRLNQATFNHPVYGSRLGEQASVLLKKAGGKGGGHGRAWTWVTQKGKQGWFDDSISKVGPEAQNKINDAMDATADYIAGLI